MLDFFKAQNINELKKISFILYISNSEFLNINTRKQVLSTLRSVARQSVPLFDLLIVSSLEISKSLSVLINQFEDEYSVLRLNTRLIISSSDDIKSAYAAVKNDIHTDWVVLLSPRVNVASHAVYQFTRIILEEDGCDLIYADHDTIDQNGIRSTPFFKPAFSLDLFYSQHYIGSFFAIKADILRAYTFLDNYLSFFNFTFSILLFLIESVINQFPTGFKKLKNKLIHFPGILYSVSRQNLHHKTRDAQSNEHLEILCKHFKQLNKVVVCRQVLSSVFRHQWPIPRPRPLVSLIVPTKNGYDILKNCIESILEKTTYTNFEIIIVDNQTDDPTTLKYLKSLSRIKKIKILKYPKQFNYSDINNFAVKYANGQILGFINNDVEVITPDWLTEMVSHAIRPDVGCVGAMHYYPDKYIQHAGVVVGMHGVADHAFKGIKKSSRTDRFGYLYSIRNPDAVTAATLLVRRELFDMVGGFDSEHLKVAFNDVDLCLKISREGFRCVWSPYAELYHHESKTRNRELLNGAYKEDQYEQIVMKERWNTDKYPVRGLLRSINLLGTHQSY